MNLTILQSLDSPFPWNFNFREESYSLFQEPSQAWNPKVRSPPNCKLPKPRRLPFLSESRFFSFLIKQPSIIISQSLIWELGNWSHFWGINLCLLYQPYIYIYIKESFYINHTYIKDSIIYLYIHTHTHKKTHADACRKQWWFAFSLSSRDVDI